MHRPMHIINSKKKKGIKPVCESREINIKYYCFLGDRLIFFFFAISLHRHALEEFR